MGTESKEANNGRKKRVWPILLIIVIGISGGAGGYYYNYVRPYVSTDNAFIEASIVKVSPQVNGQVLRVHVEDNQLVQAGELLVEIDPKPYETALEGARAALHVAESRKRGEEVGVELTEATTAAGLEQAEAQVTAAKAAVDQAHAAVAAAETEAKRSEIDASRFEQLNESAVSQQRTDIANTTARVAAARLIEARKMVVAAEAKVAASLGDLAVARTGPQQVAVSHSRVDQAAASIEQAQAAVNAAELNLSYTKVFAPVTGHITKKSVRVGETVQAGQALMAVVPEEIWVVANFKETQLHYVRVGQPVEIRVDAYPGTMLKGHVDSIQAGSGARFSLLPPENATGNYVKVIQRVPVKIMLDEPPPADLAIAPGMSVVPKVRIQ
ncbi:MAG TPA: HlyD family secretion protein [Candidatus Hydrogenedentes bacterium]|nr:HlyD family secretion protein [Candidatus Hydrogenedentota bacterium]